MGDTKDDKLCLLRWRKHHVAEASTRKNHPAVCIGGRVYILGGYASSYVNLNDVVVVEKRAGSYRQTELEVGNSNLFTPKNGHSATLVDDKLYVLGGWTGNAVESVVCVFDVVLNSWSRPTVYGTPHSIPNMHTAEYVEALDQIVCFGGGDGISFLNDVTCLQVSTMTWEPLEPKGALPGPRANHSSCIIGSSYFVIGGWNRDARFSDISILHFTGKKQATWSTVHDEFGPRARVGPSVAEFHGKVVLYGGFFEGGLKDIHIFDPVTQKWKEVHKKKGLFQRQETEYTGAQVARRFGHSMTNVGGNTLVVYGGSGDTNVIENRVFTIQNEALTP